MKTSSRSNPQPGTLVNIGSRACEPDIVFVGRYRVRRSGRYWNAYVQAGDKWGPPKRFTSRKRAFDAVAEHARSGKWEEAPVDPIGDLQRRVAALENEAKLKAHRRSKK